MIIDKHKEKMHNWFEKQASKPSVKWWLAIISFTESSFFPIPPDPFLIAALIAKREAWKLYSFIVSFSSVLGGVFGYAIGFWLFAYIGQPLVNAYGLQEEVIKVGHLFADNTFWTVFTAAFTPIPYKIFTISAGLFKVNIFIFIIASILGRSIRFYVIGYIMKVFGEKIGKLIFKYFNILTLILLLVILFYIFIKLLF